MVLGNMEIGVNTANLVGIGVVAVLAVLNMFGVGLGALYKMFSPSPKLCRWLVWWCSASRLGAMRRP